MEDVAAVVPDYKLPHPPRLGLQRLSEHHVSALIFRVQSRYVIHTDVGIQVALALLGLSTGVGRVGKFEVDRVGYLRALVVL